ncbi:MULTISPECIES: GAF domain-containing protein [unclassified Streptomyces]|uniref:GAF domain-containing protein n=1 Tax=unclassified Streptomyces TaxID=2593676 RepID=UPI00215630CE|nr:MULTISPECIES: GAF domain-containing protein [unclassified Streptomyces]
MPTPVASEATRALLQSVVEVARAIFGAAASSVFLLDEEAEELVFQAVAGEGEDFLVGTRFPASRGIAGWVVSSGQAMIADDLAGLPAFARDLAESTRYVPSALMAVPLLSESRVLGVLEVLDPVPRSRADLDDLDLLALFAHQAALALRIAGDADGAPGRPDTPGVPHGDGVAPDERLVDAFRDFLRQRSG